MNFKYITKIAVIALFANIHAFALIEKPKTMNLDIQNNAFTKNYELYERQYPGTQELKDVKLATLPTPNANITIPLNLYDVLGASGTTVPEVHTVEYKLVFQEVPIPLLISFTTTDNPNTAIAKLKLPAIGAIAKSAQIVGIPSNERGNYYISVNLTGNYDNFYAGSSIELEAESEKEELQRQFKGIEAQRLRETLEKHKQQQSLEQLLRMRRQ